MAAGAAVVVMGRQASVLYRVGRLMKTAAYVLCALAVMLLVPLAGAALGFWDHLTEPLYFTVLFFGMIVCAYHFILLMVAVRLDDHEAVAGDEGDEGLASAPGCSTKEA